MPSPAQVTSLAFFFGDDNGSRQRQALYRGWRRSIPARPAATRCNTRPRLPGLHGWAGLGLHRFAHATPYCAALAAASTFADSAFEGLPLDWLYPVKPTRCWWRFAR